MVGKKRMCKDETGSDRNIQRWIRVSAKSAICYSESGVGVHNSECTVKHMTRLDLRAGIAKTCDKLEEVSAISYLLVEFLLKH